MQSPEEVRRPDNGQVFSVHVGDRTEGGQAGKVPHEVLQRPADVKRNPRVSGCSLLLSNKPLRQLFVIK